MNYSKALKVILFLLAIIVTLQIITVVRTERMIRTSEAVVIERIDEMEVPEASTELEMIEEIEEIQPRINCRLDDETQQMIVEKCAEYNIDFAFTMAVMFRESSFRPNVISSDGSDYGLMQINKINHERLSEELGITNFLDPEQNVTAGLYMLQKLFEKYEDPALVLMAYNLGETGAKRLWDKGIYMSGYAEAVLRQAEIYNQEIQERMGEND